MATASNRNQGTTGNRERQSSSGTTSSNRGNRQPSSRGTYRGGFTNTGPERFISTVEEPSFQNVVISNAQGQGGGGTVRQTRGGRSRGGGSGGRGGTGITTTNGNERTRSRSGARNLGGEKDRPMGAIDLVKETKEWSSQLGVLLKTKMPWEHAIESLRHRLRAMYDHVLFDYPNAPASQSIDRPWVYTTYLHITAYRALVTKYESKVTSFIAEKGMTMSNRGGYQGGRGGRGRGGNGGIGRDGGQSSVDPVDGGVLIGPVELRKLLKRFRTFLVAEQDYYRNLITDMVSTYDLSSAVDMFIEAVNIPSTRQHIDGNSIPSRSSAPLHPIHLTREEKVNKVGIVHKALICLGDLTRYKEHYGAERDRTTGLVKSKASDSVGTGNPEKFEQAKRYYEVARGLLPENGNPSNQLAVIAAYNNDAFSAIYHYFRAIAVQNAFEAAEYNLAKTLRKALTDWESFREESDDVVAFHPLQPGNEVEGLKREEIVLQAILFHQYTYENFPTLAQSHLDHLKQLVRDRMLPSEIIVKTVALGCMAQWHTKMHHVPNNDGTGLGSDSETKSMEYLLAVATVLLKIASEELDIELGAEGLDDFNDPDVTSPVPPVFQEDDEDGQALHRRISAVVRRMLPPLRIFSKWLKSNQSRILDLAHAPPCASCIDPGTRLKDTVDEFWKHYLVAMGKFEWIFPIEQLPRLTDPLEEDFDMRGLLPLGPGMQCLDLGNRNGGHDGDGNGHGTRNRSEVHPNEEQLMRIADLLIDGKLIVGGLYEGFSIERFAVGHGLPPTTDVALSQKTPPARAFQALPIAESDPADRESVAQSEREYDMASISTETEDDPVTRAMRATMLDGSSMADSEERDNLDLEVSDEEEEERFIWNAGYNPDHKSPIQPTPILAEAKSSTPRSSIIPAQYPHLRESSAGSGGGHTAQDLLQTLLSGQSPRIPSAFPIPNSPSLVNTPHIQNGAPVGYSGTVQSGGSPAPVPAGIPTSNIWSSNEPQFGTPIQSSSFTLPQRSSISGPATSGLNPWTTPKANVDNPSSPAHNLQTGWNGGSRFGTPIVFNGAGASVPLPKPSQASGLAGQSGGQTGNIGVIGQGFGWNGT